MKDYNDDDKQYFDRASLAIFARSLKDPESNEDLADLAFRIAIMLTVKRKDALNDLEDEIEVAQHEEKERNARAIEEYKKKEAARKAAIMATPE